MNIPIDDALEKIQINTEAKTEKASEAEIETDFDILLSKLKSEEAKKTAVLKAVDKNVTNEKKHLLTALKHYKEVVGDYKKAGQIYEKLGEYNEAITYYLKGGYYLSAADAAVKKGCPDEAIGILIAQNRYDAAAKIAEQQGRHEQAINFYIRGDCYLEAARLCEKIGELQMASNYYYKGKDSVSFERIQKSVAYKKQKIEQHRKDRQFYSAGVLSEEIGDFESAMDFYAINGDYGFALKVAEKSGDSEKIALYRSFCKLFEDKPDA